MGKRKMIRNHSTFGKTALVLPPPWSPLVAPLGICTVRELLARNGVECQVFDLNIKLLKELEQQQGTGFNRDFPLFWDSTFVSPAWKDPSFFKSGDGERVLSWLERNLDEIIEAGYRAFGFSVFETNLSTAKAMIRYARQRLPGAVILLGGPATNDLIEYRMKEPWLAEVDYIFHTESETSLAALIDRFTSRNEKYNIPGTAYLQKRTVGPFRSLLRMLKDNKPVDYSLVHTPRERPTDVSLIPPVNFDDLDLDSYTAFGIPVEFSRGCSQACSFCSESRRFRPYRPRPIEALAHDMALAVGKYHADEVFLVCSALNGNREHLASFCEALLAKGIRVKWGGNARLDDNLDDELLDLMCRAGCTNLNFGLESGSDHVLKLMNKHSNAATASRIVTSCHTLGIRVAINLIVGFPGETEEDFDETLRFIGNHHGMVSMFNVSKCYVDSQAPVGMKPERFNILNYNGKVLAVDPGQPPGKEIPAVIPNGPEWSDWCTTDGMNTPYLRDRRYEKILEYIDTLGKRGNTPHDPKKSSDLSEMPW